MLKLSIQVPDLMVNFFIKGEIGDREFQRARESGTFYTSILKDMIYQYCDGKT